MRAYLRAPHVKLQALCDEWAVRTAITRPPANGWTLRTYKTSTAATHGAAVALEWNELTMGCTPADAPLRRHTAMPVVWHPLYSAPKLRDGHRFPMQVLLCMPVVRSVRPNLHAQLHQTQEIPPGLALV
jgi:hypothetical protein